MTQDEDARTWMVCDHPGCEVTWTDQAGGEPSYEESLQRAERAGWTVAKRVGQSHAGCPQHPILGSVAGLLERGLGNHERVRVDGGVMTMVAVEGGKP